MEISTPSRLSVAYEEYPGADMSSLVDQALCTNQRAFDIHSQLSCLLFHLRQQALGCLNLTQQGSPKGLDRTYMCVAALCEAIHSLQHLDKRQYGLANYEHSYALEVQVALLATMTVLDIYENYHSRFIAPADLHQSNSKDVGPTRRCDRNHLDSERVFCKSYSPPSEPQYPPGGEISHRLAQLVHLTVMDFHLGQLRYIFQFPYFSPASEGFMCERFETNRLRLHSLRSSLQADIENLKRGV